MRPFVISIAGFDPSSGAGITADCKTIEACRVYALGVCSAITFQNEDVFEGVEWVSADAIIRQLEILLRKYRVEYCKIGLIENMEVLQTVTEYLHRCSIRIVWDPILRASTGFTFHSTSKEIKENTDMLAQLTSVAATLFLITPNLQEFDQLSSFLGIQDTQQWLGLGIENVLLKGGHQAGADCSDFLYQHHEIRRLEGARLEGFDKHGTGCVLSAAITARLALGDDVESACRFAKQYVEAFIGSSDGLLGYHEKNFSNTTSQRHEE